MFELESSIILLLVVAALLAGFVDSIAGGGGMITIPALWFAGIAPLQALGTNKFQSCFGSFCATYQFAKKGYINIRQNIPFVFVVFVCAMLGTIFVQSFSIDFLRKGIPFLLMIFAIYFLFSPKITESSTQQTSSNIILTLLLGGIGFYDGFFGPGTGSFFVLVMILCGGFGITVALGNAKLFNFATNIASMIVFAFSDYILYDVGLLMALGQFIGAMIGSKLAIKQGIKIIKPFVVLVSFVACGYLLYTEFIK